MFHFFNFARNSRHFSTTATINNSYFINTEALGYSSGIHGSITTADNRHFVSQVDFDSKVDLPQEVEGMKHSGSILTRNPHFLTDASTCTQENGFVPFIEDFSEIFRRGICLDLCPQLLYIAYLVTEYLFR